MKTRLATLAMTTLLMAPLAALADMQVTPNEDRMPSGFDAGDSRSAAPEENHQMTIKAHVVDIDGNRLVTETEKGEQMVFLVEGSLNGLNVGDELEMKLDDATQSAEILKVLPHEERSAS
jgi:hypothetical protein